MPGHWQVKFGDRVQGPFSYGQLRRLVTENRLLPNTPVRDGENAIWVEARSVPKLFSDSPSSADSELDAIIQEALKAEQSEKPQPLPSVKWHPATADQIPVGWESAAKAKAKPPAPPPTPKTPTAAQEHPPQQFPTPDPYLSTCQTVDDVAYVFLGIAVLVFLLAGVSGITSFVDLTSGRDIGRGKLLLAGGISLAAWAVSVFAIGQLMFLFAAMARQLRKQSETSEQILTALSKGQRVDAAPQAPASVTEK